MTDETIIEWNAHGLSKSRLSALQLFVNVNRPLVVCVTEARLDPNDPVPSIKGYQTVDKLISARSSGIVMFVRKDNPGRVSHRRRADLEKSEHAVCIEVYHKDLSTAFVLCSLYHHRDSGVDGVSWSSLKDTMSACIDSKMPVLCVGDYNAHHNSWNECTSDSFGTDLFNFCDNKSMFVLNSVCCPGVSTFPTHNNSVLDLAICSDPSMFGVMDVLVDSALISDHLPISVVVSAAIPDNKPNPSQPRRDYKRADWSAFSSVLCELSRSAMIDCKFAASRSRTRPQQAMEDICKTVNDGLNTACAASVPLRCTRPDPKRWWNDPAVPTALARLRRARVRSRRCKSNAARTEWNQARANWDRVVKLAKQRSWDKFVEKVFDPANNTINWSRFNAAVNPHECGIGPIAAPNQGLPASLNESLNRLGAHYAAVSSTPAPRSLDDEIIKYVHTRDDAETGPPSLDCEFTESQLAGICHNLLHKAPGPDGVSNLVIKHMPAEFRKVILFAYNFSWKHGVLPVEWKRAYVCAIYKGRPNPRNMPKSYRPISLTSCLVKVLERLILGRMVSFLDSRSFFLSSQSGFRSYHSTLDQIYRLINRVNECFANRDFVSVVFLDIVAAFDSVWIEGLLYKLHKAGVTGRAWRWIRCFLTDRRFRVVSNGSMSDWFDLGAGVPQGSILGPFLFLVFINDVPSVFGVVVVLFADDIAIWATTDGKLGDKQLQLALDHIDIWADRWHIVFSPSKSVSMCFSRQRVKPQPAVMYMGNDALVCVDRFRYLGVIFTPRLDWSPNTDQAIVSSRRASFAVSRIVTSTGPPPRIIRQLVQALVLPIISYAWPLWCPPTDRHWNKLESAVGSPLRAVLGLHRSVQKLALMVEFGLVRPSVWHDCCALVFAHRVDVKLAKDRPNHPSTLIFRSESGGFLPKDCPKYRRPLGKRIKTAEFRLGVSHISDKASCMASLRKLALARQIQQIRLPDKQQPKSRYATEFSLWPAPATYIMSDPRDIAVLRARIRLNRHHLRSRQHRLSLADSALCRSCAYLGPQAPVETPNHILLECPRFDTARMNCLIELDLFGCSLTMDVLTGDIHNVRSQSKADVQSATAAFLRNIDSILTI